MPENTTFTDNFNRADTSLGGVGNGWVDAVTGWRITDNHAYAPNSGYSSMFLSRSDSLTSCRLRATITHPGGNSVVLWGLCDPSTANGYGAWIGSGQLVAGVFTSGLPSFKQTPVTLPNPQYDLELIYNKGYVIASLFEVGGVSPIYRVAQTSSIYLSGKSAFSSLTNTNSVNGITISTGTPDFRVIPDGDSITAGSGGVQFGWPPYCVASLGLGFDSAANVSVSGQQVTHILNGGGPGSRGAFSADVVPLITASPIPVVYIMAAGTNDFYANRSVANVLADIAAMYGQANTAGVAQFGVVKLLYRDDFPGSSGLPGNPTQQRDAHRALVDAYNSQIDTYLAGLGPNTFSVDWPGETGMTNPHDPSYFTDLVHPTVLGADLLGRVTAAAIIASFSTTYNESVSDTVVFSDLMVGHPNRFRTGSDTYILADIATPHVIRTFNVVETLPFTELALGSTGATTVVILTESIDFVERIITEIISEYPTYGTVQEADRYFGVLLHGELWERSTPIRKYKALVSATNVINTLRFAGRKTNTNQALEYPRNGDTTTPLAIRQATYEEALSLLKGIDPTTEYDNLFVRSRGFGSLRSDYEPQNPAEHKKAGITSLRAWQFLLPYLKPALDLKLRRES